MKILLLSLISIFLTGCGKPEGGLFSGRVESISYLDYNDTVTGYTRFDKGIPGASTSLKEDVWVDVYPTWVVVRLHNRKDYKIIVPKERVRSIIVGTKEGNELNIP